jgi:hypothetical protein
MLQMCTLSPVAMCACATALDSNKGLEAALQDSHAACDARDKELQEALAQLVRCLLRAGLKAGLGERHS